MLMYGAEGLEIAERYNDWGVTAFVLTYRLSPRYGENARVLDGTRAIQLVRANAAAWKLDPARIGYIGFSAGSNMGQIRRRGRSRRVMPSAADAIDRVSSRPDYLALVYGAGRATPGESLKDFPPTFLVSAAGDQGPSLANAQLFMDLTRAGAVAEVHVYQKGRHGFGSGFGSPAFGGWMSELQRFLAVGGFLPTQPLSMERLAFPIAALVTLAVVFGATAQTSKIVSDGHGDYVYVPAGSFKMGDAIGDGEARERPVHVVELDAFYVAKVEMTNGEWKKFRDDPGYDEPRFWPEGRIVPRDQVPYWGAGEQPRRRHARQRQLPAPRRELGLGGRLYQVAEREDRQDLPPADGSRVGEGRPRNRPAPLPVGKRDRPLLRQLRRRAAV